MQNYEPDVTQLLGLYQQLEDDIVADMVRRMLRMGFVSETTAYQAEVLQTAGILYDDILQMIADRTDTSVAQVRAVFEDAGVRTVEIDNDTHEAAGEAPVDIRQDGGMKQVLDAGYRKTLGTMRNLVSTTANTTQTAFLQACDRAYMQVSSGAFSYQEAIRMAVRDLADGGAYITYPTGHQDRIDVAVRRCILTGVGQTAAAVAKKRAEDSGCKYMELTARSGARPEHARWQGQLVQIQGKRTRKVIDGLKVFTLQEIGYGDGRGFKGWNCNHNWHPYYPGLSTPNYTPERIAEMNEKKISYNGKLYSAYEISQMQRKGEQKVRTLKRRAAALEEAAKNTDDPVLKQGLNDDFSAVSVRLKDAEKTLKDFCRQTGQRRDPFREQVNGFGRSTAQRAVQAAKRRQAASQTAGNVPSGHAVEVAPPVPKDNGGTGKTYQAEKIGGKALTSGGDGGIIKTELKRSKGRKREDIKPISKERFDQLTIEARKNGATIMRGGEEVESHLDNMGADASILGDVIFFREETCVSEVLEETYHFIQNVAGMNDDKSEPLRTYLNEIDAKQHLLENAAKYKIPRSETQLTKEQLEYYQEQLKKYMEEHHE